MLSPTHRLTRHAEFSGVLRDGERVGRARVVVHALRCTQAVPPVSRVGLIVSKSVGGSVARHRVSRKLRHVMRPVVPMVPAGTQIVLRALAAAAAAPSAELDADIRSALRKLGFLDEVSPLVSRPA